MGILPSRDTCTSLCIVPAVVPSRDTRTSVYIGAGIAYPVAALERQSRTLTQSRWFTRDRSPRNRKWLEQMKGTVLTLAGSRLTPWLAVFLSLRSVHAGGHGIGENGRILRTAPFSLIIFVPMAKFNGSIHIKPAEPCRKTTGYQSVADEHTGEVWKRSFREGKPP
jgi:hypothetical protein